MAEILSAWVFMLMEFGTTTNIGMTMVDRIRIPSG
jgi:hypothetical protein